jgi:hypothetical protein
MRDPSRGRPRARAIPDRRAGHAASLLIAAFGEKAARQDLRRLRGGLTAQDARRPNRAETAIAAISRPCRDRRLAPLEGVVREVGVCSGDRTRRKSPIERTVRRIDARRVFPEIDRPTTAG